MMIMKYEGHKDRRIETRTGHTWQACRPKEQQRTVYGVRPDDREPIDLPTLMRNVLFLNGEVKKRNGTAVLFWQAMTGNMHMAVWLGARVGTLWIGVAWRSLGSSFAGEGQRTMQPIGRDHHSVYGAIPTDRARRPDFEQQERFFLDMARIRCNTSTAQ